ncbi:MAG: hypothetical protein M3N82_04755 [Pseudomonadota bacterium]|nr:hypothetical protein [Pseudomonadota bacterium]
MMFTQGTAARISLAGLLLAFGSAKSASGRVDFFDARPLRRGEARDELKVIVQACIPQRHLSFDIVSADLTNEPMPPTLGELKERYAGLQSPPWKIEASIDEALDTAHRTELPPARVGIRRAKPEAGEDVSRITALRMGEIQTIGDTNRHSEGSGVGYLRGATTAGQPVFEPVRYIVGELVATSVVLFDSGYLAYWFRPPTPSSIPIGRFTEWQLPVSSETYPGDGRRLGIVPWQRDAPPLQPTPEVPLVRYMLLSQQEDADNDRERSRERNWVIKNFPGERYIGGFVLKWDDSVPPCTAGKP